MSVLSSGLSCHVRQLLPRSPSPTWQAHLHRSFSPDVVAAACHNGYLGTQWRTSLAIGCVFPIVIFVMRLYVREPEEFTRNSMRHVRTPYGLVLRFYGLRLLAVSLIWFIYDVSPPDMATPPPPPPLPLSPPPPPPPSP